MIANANALRLPFGDNTFHMCVTSPPYWALRNYGVAGQLGLEATPEEYVANMVAVFREVWRVMRDDATLWLNLGDSYNGSGGAGGDYNPGGLKAGQPKYGGHNASSLKPKDLVGIPWRVAFALQADGWYLRSDIIWSKPNPMPESVTDRPTKAHEYLFLLAKQPRYYYDADAVREDNADPERTNYKPGKEAYTQGNVHDDSGRERRNDGFEAYANGKTCNGRNRRTVWTERGEWREERCPNYYDTDDDEGCKPDCYICHGTGFTWIHFDRETDGGSLWRIATHPFKGAHFATYPPALVQPCIKAGTSERGVCPVCGKQWVRVVEKDSDYKDIETEYNGKQTTMDANHSGRRMLLNMKRMREQGRDHDNPFPVKTTTGWRADCNHDAEPIPALVFDPFVGSGTTVQVAYDLGRRGVGVDLSLKYLTEQAGQRIHNGHVGRLI